MGLPWQHVDSGDGAGFGFAGVGGTLGASWDIENQDSGASHAQFLAGAWLGGGYVFRVDRPATCGDVWQPYVSLAFGVRGDELYLAPKLGEIDVPGICLFP